MVGVTGVIPVQVEQGRLVQDRLKWVEVGSLLAVALILAVAFRSVVAPLITLVTAVIAYLLTVRLIGAASAEFAVIAPSQIQPLVVALTLGLATDYSIFFLAGMRGRVLRGESPLPAVRASVTHNAPIVLVAGLTVAAGVAGVSVAKLALFRVFGPGLAIMVLVALAVSITFVPAMLAILGRAALWPGVRGSRREYPAPGTPTAGERLAQLLTRRPVAAVAVAVSLSALIAASWPLLGFRASVSSPATLPPMIRYGWRRPRPTKDLYRACSRPRRSW